MRPRGPVLLVAVAGALWGCAGASPHEREEREEPEGPAQANARTGPAAHGAAAAAGRIRILERHDPSPAGGDVPPRLSLAIVHQDGSHMPVDGEAVSFAPFRDGLALVDPDGHLWLVAGDGTRRQLAIRSGAPPVRSASGALLYAVRHGDDVAIHALGARGGDRVLGHLAGGNVSLLAPQPDGTLLFVASQAGGVAGLWLADSGHARCLTNCGLRGAAGAEAIRAGQTLPIPGDPSDIAIQAGQLTWVGYDGATHAIPWPPKTPRRPSPDHGNARGERPTEPDAPAVTR